MLRIEHFSKTYRGGKRAVDDLSLEIEAGDMALSVIMALEKPRRFGRSLGYSLLKKAIFILMGYLSKRTLFPVNG